MKRFIVAAAVSLTALAIAQDRDRQTGHPQNQPTPNTQQPGQVQPRDMSRDRSQDDRARIETKTAAEIQQTVALATIQLPDAMRTAEKSAPSGGRMVGASYCTWESVQDNLNRTSGADRMGKDRATAGGGTNTDQDPSRNPNDPQKKDKNVPPAGTAGEPRTADTQSLSSTHPVIKVCFVGNNKLTEVIVCGKTGQVMGTKELTSIQVARTD